MNYRDPSAPYPGTTLKRDAQIVVEITPPAPKSSGVRSSATPAPGTRHRGATCAPGLSFSFACKSCNVSGFSACETTNCPQCHRPFSRPQDRMLQGKR